MTQRVEFRGSDHTYWLIDDQLGTFKKLPSVSTILKKAGRMPEFFEQLSPRYAERGTAIHLACHYDDLGDLDEKTVDPNINDRLAAWRSWKKEFGVKIIKSEFVVYTDQYAGTADKLCEIWGDVYVVDIKGGSPAAFHTEQTWAYRAAFDPLSTTLKRACVYLGKDGKAKWKPHTRDAEDKKSWEESLAKYSRTTEVSP